MLRDRGELDSVPPPPARLFGHAKLAVKEGGANDFGGDNNPGGEGGNRIILKPC